MAYCTLADVKQYLNIPTGTTTDDDLLSVIIAAAHQRINDYTKRRFEAIADATRYFDASQDTDGRALELGYDISHISAVTNENGSAVAATEYITSPRNLTPWREIILRSTGTTTWGFTTTPEDAITVTGRWAVMDRVSVTALSRATNVVTATVTDPTAISKGATVHLVSAADATFNGSFVVTGVTGSAVTWAQSAGNATSTTGVLLLVPPSIRQACTRLTAWLYRQKDNQMGDADRPIMTGDGTIIMPTTLPGDVQALLREWVRII